MTGLKMAFHPLEKAIVVNNRVKNPNIDFSQPGTECNIAGTPTTPAATPRLEHVRGNCQRPAPMFA